MPNRTPWGRRWVASVARWGAGLGITLLLVSGLERPLFGAVWIGGEASIPLPTSAEWSSVVNFYPGDGETVTVNPPAFKWTYHPVVNRDVYDGPVRAFRLQCSYEPSFANPVVNVVTSNNVYNFIGPFDASVVYWRVEYLDWSTLNHQAWSAVRSFRIAPGATRWDRSMLADSAYLRRRGEHPHLLFNGTNKAAVLRFIQTNNPAAWLAISNSAFQSITSAWWTATDGGGVNPLTTWPALVAQVAFVWQLTGDPRLLNARPQQRLNDIATYWLANYDDKIDWVGGVKGPVSFAYAYDWLYPVMTEAQRSNTLRYCELACQSYLKSLWWYECESGRGISRTYAPPFKLSYRAAANSGSSHGMVNSQVGMFLALASFADSPLVAEFLDYGLNYTIGQVYPYGSGEGCNQSRTYLMYGAMGDFYALGVTLNAAIVFPEARLDLNPFWHGFAEWWMRMNPVLFDEGHDHWGDLGWGRPTAWQFSDHRNLACFVGSPEAFLHYERSFENRYGYVHPDDYWSITIPYHFRPPGRQVSQVTARVFPREGWAIASSHPPNAYDAFTNGTGMIFQARPRGSEGGHSRFSDGSFQFWAYGAAVTDSGYGTYSKSPLQDFTLLVDGVGQAQPTRWPTEPWYSRITAWTNHDDFTYVAADLTRAYARSNWQQTGNAAVPDMATSEWGAVYNAGRASHLSRVERHLLFMRKKYWVIYDVLQSTRPATFSWIYPVLPTATVDAAACSFTYPATNNYIRSNVVVHVRHMVDPAQLTLLNQTGPAVAYNPFTQENYWNGFVLTVMTGRLPAVGDQVRFAYQLQTGGSVTFTWTNDTPAEPTHIRIAPTALGCVTNLIAKLGSYPFAGLTNVWDWFALQWTSTNVVRLDFTTRAADQNLVAVMDMVPPQTWLYVERRNEILNRHRHTIWVNNRFKSTNWHFLSVIYPQRWDEPPPIIQRVDDYTVAVTNSTGGDVITFDTNRAAIATFVVDVGAVGQTSGNSTPPGGNPILPTDSAEWPARAVPPNLRIVPRQ